MRNRIARNILGQLKGRNSVHISNYYDTGIYSCSWTYILKTDCKTYAPPRLNLTNKDLVYVQHYTYVLRVICMICIFLLIHHKIYPGEIYTDPLFPHLNFMSFTFF